MKGPSLAYADDMMVLVAAEEGVQELLKGEGH